MGDLILIDLFQHLDWIVDAMRLKAPPAGAAALLSTTDWATLISGFGGALLGAVIGAVASFVTARQAAAEGRSRDEAARVDLERNAALRVILKASSLANSIETIRGHVVNGIARADPNAMPVNKLWTYVQPTTPATRPSVNFEASDFVFLLKHKQGDLIQRLMMLATRVAALEAGFDAYSSRRTEMQVLLEDHTRYDKRHERFVTEVPVELQPKTEVRSIEMDNLLKDLLRNCYEYAEDASKACEDLNEATKVIFDGKFPIRLDIGGQT
ncbi:hypothetical protein ACLNGM_20330 [Aureimonas phyllosphaerae]|uniref:hypothetical protein n=1 Tax=Aureimonas phyllosphaerae TaxID=1166078 RepID=UPI003A5BD6AB